MAKQITITLEINPADAIRSTKAQCGQVTLTLTDSDLEKLTPEQRDTLARHVAGEPIYAAPLARDMPIGEATFETLQSLLTLRADAAKAERCKATAELTSAIDQMKTATAEYIAAIDIHGHKCRPGFCGCVLRSTFTAPAVVDCNLALRDQLPAALLQEYEEIRAINLQSVEAKRAKEIEALKEELDEQDQKEAAWEAQKKAAHEAVLARLPATLRERLLAGYASAGEVAEAVSLMFAPAPNAVWMGHYKHVCMDHLTDDQWAVMKSMAKDIPDGASIVPCLAWRPAWRKATDEELDDMYWEVDNEGDIEIRENKTTGWRIWWSQDGHDIDLLVPDTRLEREDI